MTAFLPHRCWCSPWPSLAVLILFIFLVPAAAAAEDAKKEGDAKTLLPVGARLKPHPTLVIGDDLLTLAVHPDYKLRAEVFSPRNLSGGRFSSPIGQRARLGVSVKTKDYAEIYFEVQDIRTFGSEVSPAGSPPDATLFDYAASGFDLHQGYVIGRIGDFALKVGRQEIPLDSERLMGAVDWTLQGRSFDGVTATMPMPYATITMLAVQLSDRDGTLPGADALPDKMLAGLHLKTEGLPYVTLAPLLLVDWRADPGRWRATAGMRGHGGAFGFSYDLEGYYQGTVDNADGELLVRHALLVAARAAYKLNVPFQPKGTLFVDLLSGDQDLGFAQTNTFDTLYATNHKFYGFADVFLNLPKDTKGLGLADIGGSLVVNEGPFKALAALHGFVPTVPLSVGPAAYGVEPDVVVTLKLGQHLSAQAGMAVFFPIGGALPTESAPRAFGWLQLRATM